MGSILKFIKNEYIFALITRFVNIFIAIAQSIIIARYLGPELKGISAYISSIYGIGSIIITFGMHQAYPYLVKKYGKDYFYKRYISLVYLIFGIYSLLSLPFFLTSLSIDICISILIMPLAGYSRIISYVCLIESPNKRNRVSLYITFIHLFITVALMVCTTANYFWMIFILVINMIIESLYFTYILGCKPVFDKESKVLLYELVKFGFFPMIALLMTTLNYKIDVLMLGQYDFITYSMIGVYSLGIGLADKIVVIPDSLKGVLVSKLSKGAPDSEVARICRLCMIAGLSIFFFLLIFGRWLIHLLYGDVYAGAFKVIIITSIGVIFVGYFKLIAQYNIVNGKQIKNVILLSVAILVNVIGNLVFVPTMGIYGAALATSIGNFVCGFVFVLYFSRISNIPLSEMLFIKKGDLAIVKQYFNRKK